MDAADAEMERLRHAARANARDRSFFLMEHTSFLKIGSAGKTHDFSPYIVSTMRRPVGFVNWKFLAKAPSRQAEPGKGREARIKVSSTFSKVAESRGSASGRAPQSAKHPGRAGYEEIDGRLKNLK